MREAPVRNTSVGSTGDAPVDWRPAAGGLGYGTYVTSDSDPATGAGHDEVIEEEIDDQADPAQGDAETDDAEDGSSGLFDGDLGTVNLAVRNALVTILKTRYVSHATHPGTWATLMVERSTIVSRLHDLLIDLHIDPNTRTAIKVPVGVEADAVDPGDGDLDAEELLRTIPWTVLQAGLLVSLREHYQQERGLDYDVPILVDRDELHAMGSRYVPVGHRDERTATSKINSAIERLHTMRVLLKVRGADDRYRVAPVIETLLPVDVLRRLTAEWARDTDTDDAKALSVGDDSRGDDPKRDASQEDQP